MLLSSFCCLNRGWRLWAYFAKPVPSKSVLEAILWFLVCATLNVRSVCTCARTNAHQLAEAGSWHMAQLLPLKKPWS